MKLCASYQVCSFGQTNRKICNCPPNQFTSFTKPDTSFHFNNGSEIVLCGYKETATVKGKKIFTEFILAVCRQDTIIDFWGAIDDYILSLKNDTLFVEELKILPTGKQLNYQQTVWKIDKLFFQKGKIVRKFTLNRNIRKYNSDEISKVINEYKSTTTNDMEKAELIFDRLFIATISGSQESRNYFVNFKTKFPHLGEHFNEEYDIGQKMLRQWESRK